MMNTGRGQRTLSIFRRAACGRAEGLAARDHQSICKRISAFELILPGT
jgi:hypothetical protein